MHHQYETSHTDSTGSRSASLEPGPTFEGVQTNEQL